MAVGDLDGDGKFDLVTTNLGNTISVFHNMSTIGSILFGTRVDYATNLYPLNAAIGDIDLDGKPDVAVACQEPDRHRLHMYLCTKIQIANGIIALSPKVDFAVSKGSIAVAIGDLNGNRKPDLAVCNYNDHLLSILQNQCTQGIIGTSTFAPRFNLPTGTFPFGVTIGDVDGDGNGDVLVGAGLASNAVSIYRNRGLGGNLSSASFDDRLDISTLNHAGPPVLGDLDGDGKPDVVVGNMHGNMVSLFKNASFPGSLSHSSFGPRIDIPAGGSSAGYSSYRVAVCDIDADADPEVAVINFSDASVSVYGNSLALSQGAVAGNVMANGNGLGGVTVTS